MRRLERRFSLISETCAAELMVFFDDAICSSREHPVLIDQFLSGAVEVEVDLISD